MFWIPLALLVLATIFDLRSREIPDWIAIVMLMWALAATASGASPNGWLSLTLGLATGAVLGMVLFWLGGFGGGDAKLLASLGASLGPGAFVVLLFHVALAGGVMAAIAMARDKRDVAYAPAMALGLLVFMIARGMR